MKRRLLLLALAALFAVPTRAQLAPGPAAAPVADHHQHVISPAMAKLLGLGSSGLKPIAARDVIAVLDDAGIRQAVLLSVGYIYGGAGRIVQDEEARVRSENNWAGAQAALYPSRLRAFCGFNPLKDYALAELARCAGDPNLHRGIKLHFGNSDVQLEDPRHVERLAKVFRAANDRGMAIAVHLRASISRQRPYGAAQARVLLEQLLPLAPDVPVQIAHLAGSGPGYGDPAAREALAVLAEAAGRKDPRARQLWFDVASIVTPDISEADAAEVAQRLRQVGLDRVLYGSDAAAGANLRPREGWAAFRRLPLTDEEFARIARNVAPYLQ